MAHILRLSEFLQVEQITLGRINVTGYPLCPALIDEIDSRNADERICGAPSSQFMTVLL